MQILQIIPNIDPLNGDPLPNLGIGKFQSAFLHKPLKILVSANDFYCFKIMNGFELGVDVCWLAKYLERRNTEINNARITNGNTLILESIKRGERLFNYNALTKNGNPKFGFFYKLVRFLPIKESVFSISLFSHLQVLQLLKNEILIVREVCSQQFLKEISYCQHKEFVGSMCGCEYFRIYANEILIYNQITKNY